MSGNNYYAYSSIFPKNTIFKQKDENHCALSIEEINKEMKRNYLEYRRQEDVKNSMKCLFEKFGSVRMGMKITIKVAKKHFHIHQYIALAVEFGLSKEEILEIENEWNNA
jgi:hypothetical protein